MPLPFRFVPKSREHLARRAGTSAHPKGLASKRVSRGWPPPGWVFVLAALVVACSDPLEVDDGAHDRVLATDSVVTSGQSAKQQLVLRLVRVHHGPGDGFGRVTAAASAADGSLYLFDSRPPGRESGLYRWRDDARGMVPLLAWGTGPNELLTRRPSLIPLLGGGLGVADSERSQILLLDYADSVISDLRGQQYRGNGFWAARRGGLWIRRVTQSLGPRVDTLVEVGPAGLVSDGRAIPEWAIEPITRVEFYPRTSTVFDSDGRATSAWTGTLRVIRDADSAKHAWVAPCEPVAFDADQYAAAQKGIRWESISSFIDPKIGKLPRTKPCLSALIGFDHVGNLWVRMYGPSRIASDSGASIRERLPAGIPDYIWEEVTRVGRFGPAGRFHGWFDLAPGESFLEANEDRVWVWADEARDGLGVVREYRIEQQLKPSVP